MLFSVGLGMKIELCRADRSIILAVAQSPMAVKPEARKLNLVHLTDATEKSSTILMSLVEAGWHVEEHLLRSTALDLDPKSDVLILDEISAPLLTTIDDNQWETIKALVSNEHRILWVTTGSQLQVTNPDRALIHVMSRVIRAEDRMAVFVCLDVESSSTPGTIAAIKDVLEYMKSTPGTLADSEFVERRGSIFVSRVRSYENINQSEKEDEAGRGFQIKDLHDSETRIRLICEQIGRLDSLAYVEESHQELPLKENMVEVEIYAAGVNFKVGYELYVI